MPVVHCNQAWWILRHVSSWLSSFRHKCACEPENLLQVIIVPIFWNKKADEKTTVVAAAEQVQQQLQEVGIQVGLDTTNADTPGQKYRYW